MHNVTATLVDSDLPNVWPVNVRSGLACLALTASAVLTTMGGIGGGGLFIPIYTLIAGLPVEYAIPLSSVTIAASSFVRTVTFVTQRHPEYPDQTLVDYSAVAVFTVASANFGFLGVLLSWWLPAVVNMACVILVIGVVFVLTTRKAIVLVAKYTRELKHRRRVAATDAELESRDTAMPLVQPAPLAALLRDNVGYLVLIGVTFLVVTGFTVGRTAFDRCQLSYYLVFVGQVAALVIWGGAVGVYVVRVTKYRRENGTVEIPGNIVWNVRNALQFTVISAFTGALSSYIGIGASMVLSPTLLTMGVSPEVTVSVTTLTTLFASGVAAMQYGVSGQLLLDYSVAGALSGAIGGFVGSRLSVWIIRRHKSKTCLIVVFLAAALLASLVLLVVNSVGRLDASGLELQNLC